jgi:predicted molibdopterin-dependent oxidoreductase YjgC
MSDRVEITVNGRQATVPAGISVAAAMFVAGDPPAALCGMGICFGCRVTIDGQAHVRGCQTLVRQGMVVLHSVEVGS